MRHCHISLFQYRFVTKLYFISNNKEEKNIKQRLEEMFAVTFEEPLFDIVLPVINPSVPPPHKTSPWGSFKVTGKKATSINDNRHWIVIKFVESRASVFKLNVKRSEHYCQKISVLRESYPNKISHKDCGELWIHKNGADKTFERCKGLGYSLTVLWSRRILENILTNENVKM